MFGTKQEIPLKRTQFHVDISTSRDAVNWRTEAAYRCEGISWIHVRWNCNLLETLSEKFQTNLGSIVWAKLVKTELQLLNMMRYCKYSFLRKWLRFLRHFPLISSNFVFEAQFGIWFVRTLAIYIFLRFIGNNQQTPSWSPTNYVLYFKKFSCWVMR